MDVATISKHLWEMLTDEERGTFGVLLKNFTGTNPYKKFWRPVDPSTIVAFLHKQFFGTVELDSEAREKVMQNLAMVSQMLPKNCAPVAVTSKSACPKMPFTLHLHNRNIGDVLVSVHAWDRFHQRFFSIVGDAGKLKEQLEQCFARANLSRMHGETLTHSIVRLKRLIKNGGQEAKYLLDSKTGCRFIVTDREGIPTLVTAEIPNHGTERY